MKCDFFSKCGGCNLHQFDYKGQLNFKIEREKERFSDLFQGDFEAFESEDGNHRARVEFRIHFDKKTENISYAMSPLEKKFKHEVVEIDSCSITEIKIFNLMKPLIQKLNTSSELKKRLFSIEFLTTNQEKILVTMIYHRKLTENWIEEAKKLEKEFNIFIIGRSRKQKEVLSQDFLNAEVQTKIGEFKFKVPENSFSQPNFNVNSSMINWSLTQAEKIANKNDFLELYCGSGNFTLPFSKLFDRVLATEISKNSIKLAKENVELNSTNNINFLRLSSEEFVQAMNKVREFRRIKQENIDLFEYKFSTIFVDPPRSGLDETTLNLTKNFENIIYISCNPETLHENLEVLTKTHKIENMAVFDQFPFTSHLEMGVFLTKI